MSYPTMLRVFTWIWRTLLAQQAPTMLAHEVELDDSYFGGRRKGRRGRGAAGKVPVFGILERHGIVSVTVISNVTG